MTIRSLIAICSLVFLSSAHAGHQRASVSSAFTEQQYQQVLAGTWRSPANVARDRYRHPLETLQFFSLAPGQTVIEITPGNGWYSEILAPLLHDHGRYIAAVTAPGTGENAEKYQAMLVKKFSEDPVLYGKSSTVEFDGRAPVFGPPGSADVVLTFRNVHNWLVAGTAAAMFKGFHDVLKPGGVLGVVDHRASAGAPADGQSGYVELADVVRLATAVGFKLDAESEINANPKDTKNYPEGVFSLPPTLKGGEQDKARYLAIGESDRMTLRFVKAP